MKVYCCVCGIDKATGITVDIEDQERGSSHGYCSECREFALENEYKCRQCGTLHKGKYEYQEFCCANCHVIYLEEV